MIIEAVKKYISSCPLLRGDKVNVNYLGEKPWEYSIDTLPVNPIVKKYVDGGELKQFAFVFSSRECYDAEVAENMDTARFYEEFASWISSQNRKKNLPSLLAGFKPVSIEVTGSGFVLGSTTNTARFQIQLKFIYRKDF